MFRGKFFTKYFVIVFFMAYNRKYKENLVFNCIHIITQLAIAILVNLIAVSIHFRFSKNV